MSQNYEASVKKPLTLFVVGELSGDPARWSRFSKRSFVLAETPEHALEMTNSSVVCAEVDLSRPIVLTPGKGCSEFYRQVLASQGSAL